MKCVRFLPRQVAARYKPLPGSALISIHDCSESPLSPQDGWAGILTLRFHDTDGQTLGLEVFNAQQARAILDFAQENAGCEELVVHCQMGHSRSAAVAIYLAEKYRAPCFKESRPVTWESWTVYNKQVYRQLHTVDREDQL
jgi:predicted protein tyrosine phosphatase